MDVHTKEQRSKNMSAIRSKETKLEIMVRKELWKRGIRYRKNVRDLFGNPDIAIKKYKLAVFLDSCFWHCCPIHFRKPSSNTDFWDKKLRRNIIRDKEVTEYYARKGWAILRFWEHEVKDNMSGITDEIINYINRYK
jgi:DNA mismatch endonuclease (patch repair protein)